MDGISAFRCNLDKRTVGGIPYLEGNLENIDGSLSLYFICHCDSWCTMVHGMFMCTRANKKQEGCKIKDQRPGHVFISNVKPWMDAEALVSLKT